jgi:hypothetical protein
MRYEIDCNGARCRFAWRKTLMGQALIKGAAMLKHFVMIMKIKAVY